MLRMRAVAVVLTALLSPVVCGLGLGNLKTKSPLNEPFVGRIDIVDANAKDFDSMTVKLADTAQFERAGVARDAVLLGLRFAIVSSERGADYIKITTKEPVREPFLNFLLELNWAKGRLVREYTALLDPPLYDRNRPSPAVMAPASQAMAPAPVPTPIPARAAAALPAAASDTIIVQKNDTAWGLALAHRPDSSVSVQQMILALLRVNPDAFANHNANVLRRGAVLRMPSAAELQGVSQSAAIAEIQHQHQLWEDYRQSAARHVAEAPVAAPPEAPTAPAAEVPQPAEAPKPDAHLELAAPEKGAANPTPVPTPGATNPARNSPDSSSLANEALDAKTRESADLQGKLTEAEQIIDLLQRQVKIKDEELAKFQAKLGTATEPPPVATPVPTITPPAATVPDTDSGPLAGLTNLIPESLRNAVPGGATTILGVLATLAVLIVVGLARALSGGDKAIIASQPKAAAVVASAPAAASAAPDPMLSTVQEMATYEPPRGDQDQFLRTMEASADQLAGGPQEDPLEEVNVYLAYERFDQAEELVKKVILDHPQEPKYKLRLLEIYYSANNKRAYEHAARELRDAVGEKSPLWESAVAMWTEMSPERALFAPGAVEEPETSIAAAGAKAFVDITSVTAASTLALTPGGDSLLASTQVSLGNDSNTGATLDFDLSDTTTQAGATPSAVLDITAGEASPAGHLDLTATADESDLNQMFDLTSSLEATKSSAGDIFDISGEPVALATLELGQASDLRDVDLLDVTNSGEVTFDNNSLLDVTSPRTGRTVAPDQAEAVTVNAIENRADHDEFDLGDTVAPLAADASARDTGELDFDIAALERSVQQASGASDLDDLDLTLESDLDLSNTDSAKADLDLSLNNLSALDFDLADPAKPGSSDESDVEFDLALQDTTDFENLSIDDTLELPKSATARRGMQRVDMPSESLEDLTRSMEASIAGLDLSDDHGDDDSILDLALEPLDTDGIDLDFGLDDGLGLNELDTLALDPGELRKASGAISERTVAMPRDHDSDLQAALDETDTKLNLAKAYIELGDHEGARSILNEVVADSLGEQQAEARKLLTQLV